MALNQEKENYTVNITNPNPGVKNGMDNKDYMKDTEETRGRMPHTSFRSKFKRPSIKQEPPSEEISLLYGGALIINAIIGPGIFTSPKGVVKGAGSVGLSLVIWGGFGVFSAIAALCFTELRESVTREGVEYAYISEAFGPHASFVYCWMRIAAAEPVATAIFCMAFADYTMDYIYDNCGPSDIQRKLLGICAVITLAYLNVFSSKLSEKVQILGTIGKVVALAIIITTGIIRMANGHLSELRTGFDGTETNPTSITTAIYNCLWAYGGWASVNNVTRGVRKAPRNLPRLIKVAIPTVGVIFMMTVTSYFTIMTRDELVNSEAIGVTWAERTLGSYQVIMPICIGFLALRSANATFLDAGKLSGVAVKDHYIPEVSSFVHVRSKSPLLTVITRALIAIIMIILGTLSSLLNFFIFIIWAFHGFSCLALIVLRFKNKEKSRPYKVYLFMPVIVVVGIAALLVTPFLEKPKVEFILAVSFFALSIIGYFPIKYFKSNPILSKNFDKVTIYLQLLLRVVPRKALKGKKALLSERVYHRRMSTPETRGYLRFHSNDGLDESDNSDSIRRRNLHYVSPLATGRDNRYYNDKTDESSSDMGDESDEISTENKITSSEDENVVNESPRL